MKSTPVPPSVGDSPSLFPRVFGARPFHTDGDLLALGFAPDGTLWSVEEPGVVRHWDLATQQQLAWHSLEEQATLWCFDRAARLVAAGSDELTVWDVPSGKVQATWNQPSWVTALAFRPDAALLATGHDDGVVRLWDPLARRLVRELRGHDDAVSALAFSSDGLRLASAGEDRVIRLWEAAGEEMGSLTGHTDRIPAVGFTPDGRRLVSAGWDTTARVWDLARFEPIILLNSHAAQVFALAVSPDGRRLACADSANKIHLWDLGDYRTLQVLPAQAGEVRCLAFSPDSQRLASGGTERIVHLWDARQGPDAEDAADPQLARTCLAVSPDGRRLESLGAGTALRVWDIAEGSPVFQLQEAGDLRAFAASPDGRWLAGSLAETKGPTLGLWDAAGGRRERLLEGQSGPITSLAFAGDSALLASASYLSSDVWLWNVPSGEPALLIPGAAEHCSVEALAFHPAQRLLAVAGVDWMATSGGDGHVFLWDVGARRRAAALRGGARAVAFHPAGKRLAVACLDQIIRVWEVLGVEHPTDLVGHLDAVNCVAYSPDGRWLASGGDDHTVRLWDAESGLQRGSVELDTQVKALAFSPDGRRLFTGNANTSCYQLDLRQFLDERF